MSKKATYNISIPVTIDCSDMSNPEADIMHDITSHFKSLHSKMEEGLRFHKSKVQLTPFNAEEIKWINE